MLGILCGIVGTLQATEAIKILLGKGDPLLGRLMTYDILKMQFRGLKLRRDPNCIVCGPKPTITTFAYWSRPRPQRTWRPFHRPSAWSSASLSNVEAREACYRNLREALIRKSNLMLALWDGEASARPGSTSTTSTCWPSGLTRAWACRWTPRTPS